VDGSVTLNSSVTKFAANSYSFDGASNIRLSRALIDTSSSFCFETWVYFDSTGASNDMAMLLAQYKSGEDGRLLFGAQSGNLVVRYNGSSVAITAPVSASQWHHVAWSYDGTTHRLFIDGTLEDSTTLDFPIYTGVTTQIGGTDPTLLSGYDLDGNMEDIRITTGDARYTASFTPPTASHPVTTAVTAGEGGLVWQKRRDTSENHRIFDTETGEGKYLITNSSGAQGIDSGNGTFGANGFSISGNNWNTAGADYASWTFRKAPKFFDVVTWTGNNTANRKIPHNLGSTPGVIIVKDLDRSTDWAVYHRSTGNSDYLKLNTTDLVTSSFWTWYNTAPTDADFTVGDDNWVNSANVNYVAYVFAHNDGDGEFGPDGDQDIIKCGSYTGNGSTDGPEIDLGFEPQWVMVKNATATGDWTMYDNMRGAVTGTTGSKYLHPNKSDAEATRGFSFLSKGFQPRNSGADSNSNGKTYIYMAIRRGPLAPPESATEVFDVDLTTSTSAFSVGFPVDLWLGKETTRANGTFVSDRLRGGTKYLLTPSTAVEATDSGGIAVFDLQDSFSQGAASQELVNWMWKRAPNFFDVVAYSGNSTAGRAVSHNLGVAPEMIWMKCRTNTQAWQVYHKDLDANGQGAAASGLLLNSSIPEANTGVWNSTSPTDTSFYLNAEDKSNETGQDYIAYLFASVDGVSKVGSYTSDGTNGKVIDCGFTNGARFVLIKGASVTTGWLVWDSERGIVAGNDPYLELNTADAEEESTDYIDPHSSGFIVNTGVNFGTHRFIFYAIA
jgi:hypothetical protein